MKVISPIPRLVQTFTHPTRSQIYPRKKRNEAKVTKLLVVPCFVNLLEEEANLSDKEEEGVSKAQLGLMKSCEGWWKEMAKWAQMEQECSNNSDDNN
jgi:hypothetical protein